MREKTGDVFDPLADAIVVPINWETRKDGTAIMGAGVAKQAAERWPWLPVRLGAAIDTDGIPSVRAFPNDGQWVVAFPTKRYWRKPSDLALIENMLPSLLRLAERYRWRSVALPRLGCGAKTGQLQWERVRPILGRYLDDRFVVMTPEQPS